MTASQRPRRKARQGNGPRQAIAINAAITTHNGFGIWRADLGV